MTPPYFMYLYPVCLVQLSILIKCCLGRLFWDDPIWHTGLSATSLGSSVTSDIVAIGNKYDDDDDDDDALISHQDR